MHRFGVAAFALAVSLAAACGGGSNGDAPGGTSPVTAGDAGPPTTATPPSGLPCDVEAILAQNCQKCHSAAPQFGAPMPLMTWDDLQAAPPSHMADHVYQEIVGRLTDAADPMPPAPNPPLSAADQATLSDYVAAGAPKSTGTCGTTVPTDGGTDPGDPTLDLTCTPDKTFAPATPYAFPAVAEDQYVCWGVDVTATTPTQLIGFAPKIDNTKIVHHLVMYEASDSYSPTPTVCDAAAALTWRAVYAWAPGVKALELPPQAGFPVSSSGTHYVVQMHYSNPQGLANQTDATSFAVCSSPPRQYEADVMAFGTQDIDIPAQPPPGGVFTRDCTLAVTSQFAGLHFFTALPHMHKLGVAMTSTLEPAGGGAPLDLGNMPNFDFNTQQWLPLDVTSTEGDTIRTKCSWKNTTGKEVKFGETTADEMCYSFTMYYPRIDGSLWSWAVPALTSSCTSEP